MRNDYIISTFDLSKGSNSTILFTVRSPSIGHLGRDCAMAKKKRHQRKSRSVSSSCPDVTEPGVNVVSGAVGGSSSGDFTTDNDAAAADNHNENQEDNSPLDVDDIKETNELSENTSGVLDSRSGSPEEGPIGESTTVDEAVQNIATTEAEKDLENVGPDAEVSVDQTYDGQGSELEETETEQLKPSIPGTDAETIITPIITDPIINTNATELITSEEVAVEAVANGEETSRIVDRELAATTTEQESSSSVPTEPQPADPKDISADPSNDAGPEVTGQDHIDRPQTLESLPLVNEPSVTETSPIPVTPIASITHITPLQLKSITKGPYAILKLISSLDLNDENIPNSASSYPTYVENYQDSIYIGTSIGEILHYHRDSSNSSDSYILKSRHFFHQTRRFPIKKILTLTSISKALILSGNLTSCFNLSNLEPSGIGRIKDVNDISLDFDNTAKNDSTGVHCVVFTIKQIRIINVTKDSLRLVKDISYSGIVKGLRRGKFSVVSNSEVYDLIDLENFGKIPLFPVSTTAATDTSDESSKLKPFILPIDKDEFLLTCGTLPEEPSMGIVIDTNGNVSKGTFAFDTYPRSIDVDHTEGDSIIAGFEHGIKVYSLENQAEEQSIEFEEMASDNRLLLNVGKFNESLEVKDDELVEIVKLVPLVKSDLEQYDGDDEKIKVRLDAENAFARSISKVKIKMFYINGNGVSVLKPISKLAKLNGIKDSKLLLKEFNSIQMINNSNELNFVELEYLNLLITITGLENDQFDESVWESLINGTIDPRIFCYIMGHEIFGDDIWLFNGISQRLESFKNKRIKSSQLKLFFEKFLDDWILKKSKTVVNEDDVKELNTLKTLEIIRLKILISENDQSKLSEFINSSDVSNYQESSSLLTSSPLSVANMHIKKHEYKEAIDLFKTIHDGLNNSSQQTEILVTMVDLVYSCYSEINDVEYLYNLGIWLVNKNSQIGLNFLQHKEINPNGFKTDEFQIIISKIDENSIKFSYLENLLIKLNTEKMKVNLVKNLKRWELKKLDSRLKKYKRR
jgi:hypothetical protein